MSFVLFMDLMLFHLLLLRSLFKCLAVKTLGSCGPFILGSILKTFILQLSTALLTVPDNLTLRIPEIKHPQSAENQTWVRSYPINSNAALKRVV